MVWLIERVPSWVRIFLKKISECNLCIGKIKNRDHVTISTETNTWQDLSPPNVRTLGKLGLEVGWSQLGKISSDHIVVSDFLLSERRVGAVLKGGDGETWVPSPHNCMTPCWRLQSLQSYTHIPTYTTTHTPTHSPAADTRRHFKKKLFV